MAEHVFAVSGDGAAARKRITEARELIEAIASQPGLGTGLDGSLTGWRVRHGGQGRRITIVFRHDARQRCPLHRPCGRSAAGIGRRTPLDGRGLARPEHRITTQAIGAPGGPTERFERFCLIYSLDPRPREGGDRRSRWLAVSPRRRRFDPRPREGGDSPCTATSDAR